MSVDPLAPRQQVMVSDLTGMVVSPSEETVERPVNPRVRQFIVDNRISTENIVGVEVERYYSCWDVMCGDTEPNSSDYIEITYKINNQVSVRLIEVGNCSFGEDVADELRMHIPGYVPTPRYDYYDDGGED